MVGPRYGGSMPSTILSQILLGLLLIASVALNIALCFFMRKLYKNFWYSFRKPFALSMYTAGILCLTGSVLITIYFQ